MNRIVVMAAVVLMMAGMAWGAEEKVVSKAVVKDGLAVTVALPKATFTADEPLKMEVQFKNVGEQLIVLYDADVFWDWTIKFADAKMGGPWLLRRTFKMERAAASTTEIKAGATWSVPIELDASKAGTFELVWNGKQSEMVPPMARLGPGKYRANIEIDLRDNPTPDRARAYWVGKVVTEPVEFEIVAKAAAERTKESMKGWELRVWQVEGKTQFSLLAGTNRLKDEKEIVASAVKTLDEIKQQLAELKEGQEIFLHGGPGNAGLEPKMAIALIKYCKDIKLVVQVQR